jgi:hypothetical protein
MPDQWQSDQERRLFSAWLIAFDVKAWKSCAMNCRGVCPKDLEKAFTKAQASRTTASRDIFFHDSTFFSPDSLTTEELQQRKMCCNQQRPASGYSLQLMYHCVTIVSILKV